MPTLDVLIIGGGQAGIPLAYALAAEDLSVALAERKDLGGSCVNFGCTPTKAAIASARVAHLARRGAEFGIEVPEVRVDFPAVIRRARDISATSRNNLNRGLEHSENPKLIRGHARIEGRDDEGFRVRVGDETVLARQIVVNTGTRSQVPPIEGIGSVGYVDVGNWLDLRELPRRLVVIGGGYIGLEMSQFYRRMGSEVVVIAGSSGQVAGHEDADVATALQGFLEDEGVEFIHGTRARGVRTDGDEVVVTLEGDGPDELRASHLFLATGRRPNTDDLGLETIGVELDEGGVIAVDERLRTGVDGVWAAGDVRGGPMFTHTSYDDFRVLASQMVGDGSHTTERVVPYAIFTDPELGRVGLTEREAREGGYDVEVRRFEMGRDGKSKEIGETKGFIKVILDRADGQILGASVLAVEGAELVHVYVELMNAKAPYTVLRDAVQIHPTVAEAIQSAVA